MNKLISNKDCSFNRPVEDYTCKSARWEATPTQNLLAYAQAVVENKAFYIVNINLNM